MTRDLWQRVPIATLAREAIDRHRAALQVLQLPAAEEWKDRNPSLEEIASVYLTAPSGALTETVRKTFAYASKQSAANAIARARAAGYLPQTSSGRPTGAPRAQMKEGR